MTYSVWVARVLLGLGFGPVKKATPTGGPIAPPYGDGDTIIALYQTSELTDANGDAPEQTVARYARAAFEDAGFPVTVEFGYAPIDAESIAEFRDAEKPVTGDANLLLTNADGGGASWLGQPWGWQGAGMIDRILHHEWELESESLPSAESNSHASIHELLHQAGVDHDEDKADPGEQYPGIAERLGFFRWGRTPMAGGELMENACGEPNALRPDIPGLITVHRQWFHDCTISKIDRLQN